MFKKMTSVFLLAAILNGCANNETTPAATATEATPVNAADEQQAVAAAVEGLRKAMVDADSVQLDKLTTTELSYGHSSGKVEDKAAYIQALTSGKSDFVTIDLTEQTIAVVDNAAIVRHKLSATTNDNGTAGTVQLYILTNWIKKDGNWKLLSRQAVKILPPVEVKS